MTDIDIDKILKAIRRYCKDPTYNNYKEIEKQIEELDTKSKELIKQLVNILREKEIIIENKDKWEKQLKILLKKAIGKTESPIINQAIAGKDAVGKVGKGDQDVSQA